MLIRHAPRFRSSEITPERLYLDRRSFLAGAAALALAPGLARANTPQGAPLKAPRNEAYKVEDAVTKFESATTYNNFYEFGVNKEDPARLAHTLKPRPWSVQVEGLVQQPKTYGIDDLLRLSPLEERVYALRCVEGRSIVVPWIGVPRASLLKRVDH